MKLTKPVGVVGFASVSVTVAVQVEAWSSTTGVSQETDVVVVCGAGAAAVNSIVTERLTPPPSALIVTLVVPRTAVAVAENETVTVHVGLHGLLAKVAVTPLGRADVEKVTGVVVPVIIVALIDDDRLVLP